MVNTSILNMAHKQIGENIIVNIKYNCKNQNTSTI